MKTFYIIGTYSREDIFATAEASFTGLNLKKAKLHVWDDMQVGLNEEHPTEDQFQHKTLEQIMDCPLATDGFDYMGIFTVRAVSEEGAMLIPLRIYAHSKERSNQVIA